MKILFRRFPAPCIFVLVCVCMGLLAVPVSGYGYSENYMGYLGDTIDLHGVSYNSGEVYLFFTGPGLPANGVTLTDITQRADQGHFTIVEVGSDQTWAMKWDTYRLKNEINPGSYTVYVVNAPVDASNLAGSSYQTLRVDLKDSNLAPQSAVAGPNYTLHPGRLTDDNTPAPTPSATTPAPTTLVTTAATTPVPPASTSPPPPAAAAGTTTRSTPVPLPVAVPGLAILAGFLAISGKR